MLCNEELNGVHWYMNECIHPYIDEQIKIMNVLCYYIHDLMYAYDELICSALQCAETYWIYWMNWTTLNNVQ